MLSEDGHRPKIKEKKTRNNKNHNKSFKKEHQVHGASSLTVENNDDYEEEECATTQSALDTVATLDACKEDNDVRRNGTYNNGGGIFSSWEEAFAIASKIRPDDSMLPDVNLVQSPTTTTGNDDKLSSGVVQISRLIKAHNKLMYDTSHSNPSSFVKEDAPTTTRRRHKRKRSKVSNNDDAGINDNADSSSLEGRMTHIPSDCYCDSSSSIMASSVLVLVHNKSGIVYSAVVRNEDGTRLIIGKIVADVKKGGRHSNPHNNNIVFDSHALKEMKRRQKDEEVDNEEEISIDKITKTSTIVTQSTTTAAAAIFPYPTNPDDHCETPLKSYEDILPLLNDATRSYSSSSSPLKIYDPYYCDGSVVKHLSSLGYNNVYNKKEDCYKLWQMKSESIYDILITNPPYSEDHLERLMNYVTSQSFGTKAWLLLMPTWVHKKEYYITATTNRTPFYIVPKKRYIYLPPPKYRNKKDSDVHKKSSPFVSMWYCWGGTSKRNEEWMNAFRKNSSTTCDLARSRSALRDLRRSGGGKVRK